jgi:hypothetical protein
MHLSISTCRGRAEKPHDYDIGDLSHLQNSDRALQPNPKGWDSLTNTKYVSEIIFPWVYPGDSDKEVVP